MWIPPFGPYIFSGRLAEVTHEGFLYVAFLPYPNCGRASMGSVLINKIEHTMTIVTFLPPIAEQTGRADNATVEKVALPSYSGRAGVKPNERIELRTLWLSKNWIHRIGRHVFCTFVLFSSLQRENFPPTTERSRGGYFSGPLGRVMLLRRIEWNTVHYRTGRMSLLFFSHLFIRDGVVHLKRKRTLDLP